MDKKIVVRDMQYLTDFDQCIKLQEIIWGKSYGLIPKSMLQTAKKVGGLALGAFEGENLTGFVYSMPGVWPIHEKNENKELIHWSYRAAVSPDYQNKGIGKQLKNYQIDYCKSLGFTSLLWSFDPFEARNAHLNINKFNAIVKTFVPNMYEGSRSYRHRRAGTHRLVVELSFSDKKTQAKDKLKAAWQAASKTIDKKDKYLQKLNEIDAFSEHPEHNIVLTTLSIPLSSLRLKTKTLEGIKQHMEIKFTSLFEQGFQIIEFYKNFDTKTGMYVLAKQLKGKK